MADATNPSLPGETLLEVYFDDADCEDCQDGDCDLVDCESAWCWNTFTRKLDGTLKSVDGNYINSVEEFDRLVADADRLMNAEDEMNDIRKILSIQVGF